MKDENAKCVKLNDKMDRGNPDQRRKDKKTRATLERVVALSEAMMKHNAG